MYRRRYSPYSQIDEIERSRSELVQLILLSILAGIILNVLAGAIYDWLLYLNPSRIEQVILLLAGALIVIALMTFVAYKFFGRQHSQVVQLDVAIPYRFPERGTSMPYMTVARQHPFRPRYEVAWLARTVFTARFPRKKEDAQNLAAEWQEVKESATPIQHQFGRMHGALVDVLLVYALHRYGENALGPEAPFDWWHVPLDAQSHTYSDLPDLLRDNPFLKRTLEGRPNWKLLVPEGVQWYASQGGSGSTISLVKPRWGRVTIERVPEIWVSKRSQQPGRVLSEGLPPDDKSDFYVLGSRIAVRADFEWAFLPSRDAFHLWATGLLAQLEEALDWGFFLRSRADRIIWDIPWKIGDLPGPETSLWKKLCEMEDRLKRIGSDVESLNSEMRPDKQRGVES